MDACTIIARNYLPHARVLAESFLEHHPEGSFAALVIDDTGEGALSGEPFRVLSPYDIGLERDEIHRMAFIYDVKEFATAVKPWLLSTLLDEHEDVAYFDPDIQVFARLDDISPLARSHGVVLTPHTTEPLPRDGLLPNDEMVLRAGIYNLGFIAVGRKGRPFLDWWAERLKRDCLVDVEQGIFVDQRWIDFVPSLFEHVILGDPACNVAYWNLSHRGLSWNGQRYEVGREALRFFHFSGFSPDDMGLLSAHMGSIPRILIDDIPDVRRLCDEYAIRLREQGFGRDGVDEYRFDTLPNGLRVDGEARRDVREAIVTAERAGHGSAPDPFDPRTVEAFIDWLAEPVGSVKLPRYLDALHRRRGDLRHAFPEAATSDGTRFLKWAYATRRDRPGVPKAVIVRALDNGLGLKPKSRGQALEDALRALAERHSWLAPASAAYRALGRRLVPSVRTTSTRPRPRELVSVPSFPPLPGVNVAGYLRAELGVGEAARRLITGLEAGAIPHSTVTYRRTTSRQQHPFRADRQLAAYDTNIVCVNADELSNFRSDAPRELFAQRYTIGFWFWEVSSFPRALHGAFDLLDEVWVGSEFVREALSRHTDKPVQVVPLPVEAPPQPRLGRSEVGLPDGFTFLFSFDFLSVVERKNPSGLIDAFTSAFEPGEGPVLIVKTINGDQDREGLERLRRRAAGRPDVRIVDGYVSVAKRDALTALCDCYVSLHRSEGYGLTMAEAMASGTPVIATGYSGNMSFMDEGNSLLVPYRMTPIPAGCEPYPVGAEWAEPDLAAASRLMRQVWEDPDRARTLGRRAREDVLRRNTPRRTAEFVAARLDELRGERDERARRAVAMPLPGSALLVSGRGPTRLVRRLLHRLLWPYFVEQQAFLAAVATSLRSQGLTRGSGPPSTSNLVEIPAPDARANRDLASTQLERSARG